MSLSWKASLDAQLTPRIDGTDWESLVDYSAIELEKVKEDIEGITAMSYSGGPTR
jgi:hypothetical protein